MPFELGMREISIAVLAIVILLIITMLLLGLINPVSDSAFVFGEKTAAGGLYG